MLKSIKWRIFAILLVAGLLGVLAVLPFMFDLIGSNAFAKAPAPEMPLWLIVALALLQNGILLAVVIFFGMILSEKSGLQMPLIRAWATGGHSPNLKGIVFPGLLVGAATGAVLVGTEALFFLRHLPATMLPIF